MSEVGCVHTALGRDFRYAGIIFGDDIDEVDGKVKPKNQNVINAYYVLLTRGIYGHGLYIPNENLKNRFIRFLKRVK